MDQPHYEFETTVSGHLFSFISEGEQGSIEKRVQFSPMRGNVFNLAFGDWNELEGKIDDMVVTNNGDMEQVLATVIEITRFFLSENIKISVFLTGSTPARTRLYQMIINKNLDIIKADFDVAASRNGHWRSF
ncbi:DUF6934 family protein [Dyadobacter sp. OTU695]|uniref:DUF6934 family protein n=1 Tax=Dyadobacter sp. OTU695 TaxID=3043860 RepID=UPI00313CF55A